MTAEMPVCTLNKATHHDQHKISPSKRLMPGLFTSFWNRFLHKHNKVTTEATTKDAVESTSAIFPFEALPDEMLVQVFSNLNRNELLNARVLNKRCNKVVLRNMRNSNTNEPFKISRLTITYVEELKSYKLSWCKYSAGKSMDLFVAADSLDKTDYSLGFCFAQLEIQQLFIESMPKDAFTDKFVQFLCCQFQNCRDFKPSVLNIKNVDLCKLSSDGLKKLLAACAKRLEILEFFGIGNVASDLITDEHLSILEPNRVRRLSIQFNDSNDQTPVENLQVGDESLQAFLRLQVFPVFSMGHCLVTARAVCEYVKEWLTLADKEDSIKSNSISVTDCPHVSNESLEEELQRQNLNVTRRQDDDVNKFPFETTGKNGSLVSYTVRLNKQHQEFAINLFTTNH